MARRGLTLIELLVAMAIVAILLTLSAAGIMWVRESARRMSCSNHLRQIALASENYVATHGVFASGGRLGLRNLAHFLEGTPGQRLIGVAAYDPCNVGRCPEDDGSWQRPAVYLCPSDSWAGQSVRGASYRFCAGLIETDGPPGISNGNDLADFDRRQRVRPSDVSDGLSQTVLASEQLLAWWDVATDETQVVPSLEQAGQEPLRYHWAISEQRDLRTEFARWEEDCRLRPIDARHHQRSSPFSCISATYGHTQRPNQRSCFNSDQYDSNPLSPPTSLHRGGVFVVFGDAHARFISDSIDLYVWRAIGTRAGAEEQGGL